MLNDLSIRVGQDKDIDIDVLVKFNMALAWETEGKELSKPVVTRGVQTLMKNSQYGFYVVAETANEVVGSLMVTYEWSDWRCGLIFWIQSVYVKPKFRQQGVFRRLYEFLKEKASNEADTCGFRLYVEKSNLNAQNTYGKVGMKETSYKVFEELFEK